jgi:hypothetical protein
MFALASILTTCGARSPDIDYGAKDKAKPNWFDEIHVG